jgi:FAD/FMN-containing dehydrogenase
MLIAPAPDRAATAANCAILAERLTAELGPRAVSTDPRKLLKASSDWSRMSPVLMEKVPPGRYLADVLVRPATGAEVARVLQVAYELDLPVTPRGAGTGNYGQATPFDGGVLLDLRALDRVEVGAPAADGTGPGTTGTLTAGAGARLTAVDAAARAAGRDMWIFPSTKGSTIGGFLAGGSAGTGTIEHGTTTDGWVTSVTVAPMDGSGALRTHTGEAMAPYLHTYGVTGVLTEVAVRTDPARDWVAVYASFAAYADLVAVHRSLLDLPVLPRLASADEPDLVATLPAPFPLDATRHSLRVIAEACTVEELCARVLAAGGAVVAVLEDYAATDLLSSMSYNHPVYFRQRAGHPCFHMETGGLALWDDPDAVRAIYPGTLLHLELMARAPLAMVVGEYQSEEQVLAGIPRFDAIGMGVHSPHQWYVDRNVDLARATARTTDPKGLLNPGKLVDAPPVDTRVTIGAR